MRSGASVVFSVAVHGGSVRVGTALSPVFIMDLRPSTVASEGGNVNDDHALYEPYGPMNAGAREPVSIDVSIVHPGAWSSRVATGLLAS